MAKDKKSQKGNGGKQHAVRFGDVGAATAASEAGRARKRRDRHGRLLAKEQSFAQLVAQASTDERLLIEALDGKHQGELLALELEREGEIGAAAVKVSGTIVLQIRMLDLQPAVAVVRSTYAPIKAHEWYMLPLYTLMVQGFVSQNANPHLRAWLNELATTLQVVCKDAIEVRRQARRSHDHDARVQQEQKVHAPQLGVGAHNRQPATRAKAEAQVSRKVAKPLARLLTWMRIEGKVGYFTHDDLFYDGLPSGSAFIRQMMTAGARKLVLAGVSKDHSLKGIWEKVDRKEVQVDLAEVFPKGPVTATSSDDTPMRAARREFARYLKERHDELKALDSASAVMVPVGQPDYDPFEVRGIYEQMSPSS